MAVVTAVMFSILVTARSAIEAFAAAPPLAVTETTRADLPLPDGSSILIPVARADGIALPANELNATILTVSGPRGGSLEGRLLELEVRAGEGGAALVVLKPKPEFPRQPGTYTARLQLADKGADRQGSAKMVSVQLVVAASVLDATSRAPRAVRLTRSSPIGDAAGRVIFAITPEGVQAIEDLAASLREVRAPGAAQQSAASASGGAAPAISETVMVARGASTAFGATPPPPKRIAPGQTGSIAIEFAKLDEVGVYSTALLLNATTFEKPVEVPISITVSDGWCVPALVILAGVLSGLIVTYLTKTWRPQQELRLRLLRLGERADELAAAARDASAALTQQHAQLGSALHEALAALDDGTDIATVTASATAAEQQLTALQKALAEAQKTVLDGIAAQRAEVTGLRAFDARLEQDERAQLAGIGEALAAAEICAVSSGIGAAERERAAAAGQLDDLQRRIVARQAAILLRKWQDNNNAPPGVDQELQAAEAAVAGEIDLAAMRRALQLLDQVAREFPGARQGAGAPLPPDAVPDQSVALTIDVSPEEPRRGEVITATLMVLGAAPATDVIWSFGDGSSERGAATISHIFNVSGNYVITATLPDSRRHSVGIGVLPPERPPERARIRYKLAGADLVVTAVSVVLAVAFGLQALWVGKVFGTAGDYLTAFGWGFGIDQGVRGITAVLARVRGG